MNIQSASVTLVTSRLKDVCDFYKKHFSARASFDCGWYVVLRLSDRTDGPELCLMEPRHGMGEFAGGATLNLRVADADSLHGRLIGAGLKPTIPLEDHPWGDRGFGIVDPCGLAVYCYHPIEPTPEYKQYILNP